MIISKNGGILFGIIFAIGLGFAVAFWFYIQPQPVKGVVVFTGRNPTTNAQYISFSENSEKFTPIKMNKGEPPIKVGEYVEVLEGHVVTHIKYEGSLTDLQNAAKAAAIRDEEKSQP